MSNPYVHKKKKLQFVALGLWETGLAAGVGWQKKNVVSFLWD